MKDVYEVPAHKYNFAGFINKVQGKVDPNTGQYDGGLFNGMDADLGNAMGAVGSAVGGVAGGLIGGGRTSPAGDLIGGLGKIAGAIPGPWGAIAGAGLGVISGLTNAAFGTKMNQENINAINNNIGAMNNFQSNASSFDQLAQNINSQPVGMKFDQSFVGKNGWFNKGATKKFNQLQAQQDMAQQFVNNSLDNNMNNLINTQSQNLLANYAAKGGPLATQGSDWLTGLNYIGAGGSHEQNPNGGIQQGIAPDGLPNLVEEGEVIWNGDYVFSKRLKVPKATRNKYKLRGTKPMSFADAALEFNKEMEERPNDPISKRGRDGMLAKLAEVQEEKRAKIQAKEQAQQAAMMGMMGMPQDQMAMQEQPMQDDVMSEANQEELARQEIMQGMQQPVAEGYAAKGGPIGHKFALGTPPPYDPYYNFNWNNYWNEGLNPEELERFAQLAYKQQYGLPNFKLNSTETKPTLTLREGGLGREYYDWLDRLSDEQYSNLLGKIYPNKGKTKDNYNKFINDRVGLFNYANTGVIGDAYNGIKDAALHANPDIGKSPMPLLTESPFDNPHLDGQKPILTNTDWYRNLPVVVGDRNVATNTIIPGQARNSTTDVVTNTGTDHTHPAKTSNINKSNYPWQGYLRYAPAIGSAIGVFSDLMGWTNKPDYSAADAMLNASRGVRDVSFNPIGDYAQYRPVDTRFALNALNGAAGATRRGIMNTSAGNRGTAMAGMLAADNNYMNSIGNTLFTAENSNYDRYLKALAHNADINKFNSEGFLKAAMANQGAGEVRAKYTAMAADARQRALAQASAARSANLTNLFDNLGNIGIDALNRADARWLAQFWKGANAPSSGVKHGGRIRKRRRGRVI